VSRRHGRVAIYFDNRIMSEEEKGETAIALLDAVEAYSEVDENLEFKQQRKSLSLSRNSSSAVA
jgi:hypothetical protein